MEKSNVKVLANLEPKAIVVMKDQVSAPIDDVVVESTIDYKNNPKEGKSPWQGYMITFANTDQGSRLIPISASELLTIQLETGVSIFTETEEGHKLIEPLRLGLNNGEILVENLEGEE
jgi:hypothetical protein